MRTSVSGAWSVGVRGVVPWLALLLAVGGCSSGDDASPAAGAGTTAAGGGAGKGGSGGQAGSGAGSGGSAGASGSSAGASGQGGSGGAGAAGAGAGGSAGSAGGAACVAASDCELPKTNPVGCAEAACEGGVCVLRAKDKDGDGKRSKLCKDTAGEVTVETGNDCDDSDPKRFPGAWDGPEGEGQASACDGVDNDCSGTADDSVLSDGTSCACKPGAVGQCSEDSSGKAITWPAGEPKGECKYGSRTCVVDGITGLGQWGPCTDAVGPVTEECNGGKDDDCDGKADDEDDDTKGQFEWLCDADNDGEAAFDAVVKKACVPPPIELCNATAGASAAWGIKLPKTDCDDGRANVNQHAAEVCDAGSDEQLGDENCDGQKNEGCDCQNGQTQGCFVDPGGQVIPNVNGAAVGACKGGMQTCTGGAWGPCLGGVGPKLEVCANASVADDDCDGEVDDELDKLDWYCDGDNDGFAAADAKPVESCGPPSDGCAGPSPVWKLNLPTTDCNDQEAIINPNAQESCDGGKVDDNCNGQVNEGCKCDNGTTQKCLLDIGGAPIPSAGGVPIGACKAGNQTCFGGQWGPCIGGVGPQPETCSNAGADNDCDGDSSEADDKPTFYCDADNDGFLSTNQGAVKTTQLCGGPPAPGANGCAGTWRPLGTPFSDCDDGAFAVNPNAPEVCDLAKADDNCNGQKNEGCTCTNGDTQDCFVTSAGATIPNANGKAIGECKAGKQTCQGGQWGVCQNGVGPAQESCANIGKDNDCDGDAQDADDKPTFYCDPDSDGFLSTSQASVKTIQLCGGAPPAGSNGCAGAWRPQGTPFTDCGEGNGQINPNGVEVCDATKLDENCNGQKNENCGCTNGDTRGCFTDPSGNPIPNSGGVPIGECRAGTQTCGSGQWGACLGGQGPVAEECDGKDNNCNGQIDDGAPPSAQTCTVGTGQCQKSGPLTCVNGTYQCAVAQGNPTAETCNGLDDDCDGLVDDGPDQGAQTVFDINGKPVGGPNYPGNACWYQIAFLAANAPPDYVSPPSEGTTQFPSYAPTSSFPVNTWSDVYFTDVSSTSQDSDYTEFNNQPFVYGSVVFQPAPVPGSSLIGVEAILQAGALELVAGGSTSGSGVRRLIWKTPRSVKKVISPNFTGGATVGKAANMQGILTNTDPNGQLFGGFALKWGNSGEPVMNSPLQYELNRGGSVNITKSLSGGLPTGAYLSYGAGVCALVVEMAPP